MRKLIADGVKVQMCVTSPPYWGLRDYGTASWEGGDAECDHNSLLESQLKPGSTSQTPVSQSNGTRARQNAERLTCRKCGAKRIDNQLGLEKTPEEYVQNTVEVFRLVRELLKDDGVLWLNLGTSYAGSGGAHKEHHQNPGLSNSFNRGGVSNPPALNAKSCDNGGIEPLDLKGIDPVCCHSDGECQGGYQTHQNHTSHIETEIALASLLPCMKAHDIGHQDLKEASLDALPLSSPESKRLSSSVGSSENDAIQNRETNDPLAGYSCSDNVQGYVDKKAYTSDIVQKLGPLTVRKRGKESFFSACDDPFCKGLGKCGLCWVSLTIPFLNVKQKDELNIPHLTAMALQADGWILRQTIIWAKPNPMPESVTDRCTKSHEYIFLLSKKANYYYDADAIKEPVVTDENSKAGHKFGGKKNNEANSMTCHSNNPGKKWEYSANRNKRSVWTVATKPFRGAMLLADYVGVDGNPYKASPDCPFHGPMLLAGMFDKASNGGRPVRMKTHNPDIRGDLFAWQDSLSSSRISRTRLESSSASSLSQKTESNHDYKTEDHRPECLLNEQTPCRNSHNPEPCEHQACSLDSENHLCLQTAIDHSTEKSRKSHEQGSLGHDISFSQIPCHKSDILPESVKTAQDHDNAENKEPESCSGDNHLTENLPHNSGIEIISSYSCDDNKPKECTCQQVFIDHFATFPPALIEPCILAGSRKGDTVLDPFFGSGTTGMVSEKHGREWIGIDLNPKYYELSKNRTAQRNLIA
jgi:DNA modification methylase